MLYEALIVTCALAAPSYGAEWTSGPCVASEFSTFQGREFRTLSDCLIALESVNNVFRAERPRRVVQTGTCRTTEHDR